MYLWIVAAVLLVIIILNLFNKIHVVHPVIIALYLPFAVNIPLLVGLLLHFYGTSHIVVMIVLGIESLYFWVRMNIFPIYDNVKMGLRLKALAGARPIAAASIYISIFQLIFLIFFFNAFKYMGISSYFLIANIIYSICCCLVLFLNGTLRAFICSRRLGVVRRVVLLFTMWIPVLNWIIWATSSHLIKQEYSQARERIIWEETIPENDNCRTKYPILMVHGVGFRDLQMYNYWGRIPRFLKRFGADLHYGNQEGLATIEQNGEYIKKRIEEIIIETGAEKVNIIAHSKGGLDARYAISSCGMGDKVASLTTMNTPHHGCKFADVAYKKVKGRIYNRLSKIGDTAFRIYGDVNPDFYNTMIQFRTSDSEEFNNNNPDHPGIYYQSYMSVMKKAKSDSTLSIPFMLIKHLGEENDGLVSISSAQWGEFRGVFRNKNVRGISHADIIDLHREDIKGFNVFEVYINLVSELKTKGF